MRERLSILEPLLSKVARDTQSWDYPPRSDRAVTVAFLNQHGVNTALRDEAFHAFLSGSDYLLRDGIGVKIAMAMFGLPPTANLNGTDLIPKILDHHKGLPVALFGASHAAIDACATRLQAEGHNSIVAVADGFQPDDYYVTLCRETRPDIVVLCMGMPRQELLAVKLAQIDGGRLIICGGGWADFYSGIKVRAPKWMQRLSLEWLHRLCREPARLGKRYTVDIGWFFLMLIRARLQVRNAAKNDRTTLP